LVSLNCCHIWSTYKKNTSVGNFTDSTRIGAAHRCTMFLCHLDLEINTENSEYRNPNDNYNTKIIRQFTRIGGTFTSTVLGFKYMHSQFAAARVPSLEINLEWKHPCLSFACSQSPWSPSEISRLARVPRGSAPAEIDQLWTWRSTVSCYLHNFSFPHRLTNTT